MLRRLSSRATQGLAAFFSSGKKDENLICSPSHNNEKQKTFDNSTESHQQHTIYFNPVVLFGSFISFAAIAFYAGVIIRILMLSNSATQLNGSTQTRNLSLSVATDWKNVKQLPPPTVIPGKEVPPTTYTSKHFGVEGSRQSYDLHLDRSDGEYECELFGVDVRDKDSPEDSSDDEEDDIDDLMEGLHLPAGQHLLVDMKNVDPIFLNSEERLAEAMIQLVDESKLTLLSYHCQ